MVSIYKDFNNPPKVVDKAVLQKLLLEKHEHDFDKHRQHYRQFFEHLLKLYGGRKKCAYCECDPSAGSAMAVEHYRPKKPCARLRKKIEDQIHKGYYWLGYVWGNLLIVCSKCNGGKLNSFPIMPDGIRCEEPPLDNFGNLIGKDCLPTSALLLKELPYLLNPEVEEDEVEKHLKFENNGHVSHLSERGRVTIHLCKLDRSDLVDARRRIIEKHIAHLRDIWDDYVEKKNLKRLKAQLKIFFKRLQKESEDKVEDFLRLRQNIFADLSNFIIANNRLEFSLHENYRKLTQIAFDKYIQGDL